MKNAGWICLRIAALVLALAVAYMGGWQASVLTSNQPKQAPLQFRGQSVYVPRGYTQVMAPRDPSNQEFHPGDRVDILVEHQGEWMPLIIDTLVAREDWQTVVFIVRQEQQPLIYAARREGLAFSYRFTIAPR